MSLRGSAIRQDQDANEKFYGNRFRTRDIVLDGKASKTQSTEAVSSWLAALQKFTPAK